MNIEEIFSKVHFDVMAKYGIVYKGSIYQLLDDILSTLNQLSYLDEDNTYDEVILKMMVEILDQYDFDDE